MKADRPLYIDMTRQAKIDGESVTGVLCDTPPPSGFKIASREGFEVLGHVVRDFRLKLVDGRVTQNGKSPDSPKSSPDPMVADRDLFADADGGIFDEPQPSGIKVADEGAAIPVEYQRRYNLIEQGGIITQAEHPRLKEAEEPENKMAEKPKNKGARGSGGFTVSSKGGKRTSKGAS